MAISRSRRRAADAAAAVAAAAARRRRGVVGAATLVAARWSATASAQLDPLLFIKRVPPTVIIVFDTSLRMLEDGSGNFYDPTSTRSTADPAVMGAFPNINTGDDEDVPARLPEPAVRQRRRTLVPPTASPRRRGWDPANR